MFWGGELAEQFFGQKKPWAEVSLVPSKGKLAGAAVLLLASVVLMAKGQPTPAQKFDLLGAEVRKPLEERGVFVHPAEVVGLKNDINVQTNLIDLRDEHDFNLFHVGGARRIDPATLTRATVLKDFLALPASAVTFLMGNGEAQAVTAWKELKAAGVGNLYVVEGGVNRWLELYGPPACVATPVAVAAAATTDAPAWRFAYATGASLPAAWPEIPASHAFQAPCQDPISAASGHQEGHEGGHHGITWPTYQFAKKVKLKSKAAVKGGCG
jgi:rhodanese-related sulfurtransferase